MVRARNRSWGGDSGGYRPGQNFLCKITEVEAGGYACIVLQDNLPAFLPTTMHLTEGEEIMAQYVCVHNQRILLSARFVQIKSDKDKE